MNAKIGGNHASVIANKLSIFDNPEALWDLISESNDNDALEVMEEFVNSKAARKLLLIHLKKIFEEEKRQAEEKK